MLGGERRHQAKQNSRYARRGDRKKKRTSVHRNRFGMPERKKDQRLRHHAIEHAQSERCHREPSHSTREREQHTFGEQLTYDPPSPSAQRSPHRDFFLP